MQFRAEIEMSNAAFAEPDPEDPPTYSVVDEHGIVPESDQCAGIELARLLRKVADEVESGMRFPMHETVTLLDRNGNTVGRWAVSTPYNTPHGPDAGDTCAICDLLLEHFDPVTPWPVGTTAHDADEWVHMSCIVYEDDNR